MRILLASVTNKPERILRPHLESIKSLELPEDVTLTYAYHVDRTAPEETWKTLEDFDVTTVVASLKPENAQVVEDETTHHWNLDAFSWLGAEKQGILERARSEDFDALFFVDSDLVLSPDTLKSLLSCQKDIVSAVFWTRWTPDAPELPQVWLEHPYQLHGRGMTQEEFLRRLSFGELVRVGGLGACTLLSRKAVEKASFARVEGLPSDGMWQGEDRHFCINAERAHLELWADAWPLIHHLYRDSDLETLADFQSYVSAPPRPLDVGVWASFTLEPLESPEVAGSSFALRGRLGQLTILPEIEQALKTMKVDESRIVEVEFPGWWPIAPYRGQTKNILVTLHGVR